MLVKLLKYTLSWTKSCFFFLILFCQVFIVMDILYQGYGFHEACTFDLEGLHVSSKIFCKFFKSYTAYFENPKISAMELEPLTSLAVFRTKRKNILKKLHPDNRKTGDEELFSMASDFFQNGSSSFDFNTQKRNLFVLGKYIKREDSAENHKMVYDVVQEVGTKLSLAVLGFSLFNAFLLYASYKLWAQIVFFCLSLVLLIGPLGFSFMAKISMMELRSPIDFRDERWFDFLESAHTSHQIFPNWSLQELEYFGLHLSVFWLLCLMVSLPRKKRNKMKDLIETHIGVAKINRGEDEDVNQVFMKVKSFIETYGKSSFWNKCKNWTSFILLILFIFVIPRLLIQ